MACHASGCRMWEEETEVHVNLKTFFSCRKNNGNISIFSISRRMFNHKKKVEALQV